MQKATLGGSQEAYILKGDVSGYFMSMPRQVLYDKVLEALELQFPHHGRVYELCRYLWYEIIFDDPTDGVKIVGSKHKWASVPPNKSLLHQPNGRGIVIGNVTSQVLSNLLLNDFEWWVIERLGYPFYVRYVDDFMIIAPQDKYKEALEVFNVEIPMKLAEIGLTMHPNKKYIQPVRRGVPFLGQYVHPYYTTPSKRFRGNYYKAAKEYMMGIKGDETIISYLGMGKHTCQQKLNAKVFSAMGWEYIW